MKFEQSRPDHEVHEIHRPMGHGLQHDRLDKRGRSPITPFIPGADSGAEPGSTGAGSPGVPSGQYSDGANLSQ